MDLKQLITGGFLSGYKTYIVGALMALTAVMNYTTGITDLQGMFEQVPLILQAFGLMALRAGVSNGGSNS